MCHGYWASLVHESEPMPTNPNGVSEYHLDFMALDEIYADFCGMALGCFTPKKDVASVATLMAVKDAHFKHLKIRKYKLVDGKDVVRATLRDALLRAKTNKERMFFRALREKYRETLRLERSYYWADRVFAWRSPETLETYIVDGASQSYCKCPRFAGTDVGYASASRNSTEPARLLRRRARFTAASRPFELVVAALTPVSRPRRRHVAASRPRRRRGRAADHLEKRRGVRVFAFPFACDRPSTSARSSRSRRAGATAAASRSSARSRTAVASSSA